MMGHLRVFLHFPLSSALTGEIIVKTILLVAILTINGQIVDLKILHPFNDINSCKTFVEERGEAVVNGILERFNGPLDYIGLVCKESWKTQ